MSSGAEKSQIRIAYADDHRLVRQGIAEFINTFEDCEVSIQADNGLALIEQIQTADTLPDLCIVDNFMPVLSGLETVIRLKQLWPNIKALVLTANNSEYYLVQMIRAGANGYILKSCSPEELEDAIRSVHQHGIYHSDILTYDFYHAVKSNEVRIPELTDNEIELLKYCCSDLSYDQIASKMGTTMGSVDWCRNSLFKKLGVKSRSSLVMYAIQLRLIDVDA